jgi:hypothetical protein
MRSTAQVQSSRQRVELVVDYKTVTLHNFHLSPYQRIHAAFPSSFMVFKEGCMVPGKIKIPHIPPVQRSRAVILQDGVRRFIGHDIIAVTDQLPQFVVYGFQPFCGSHHPVTHRGGEQAHTLAFKDFQLSVQGQMVIIFGRNNMSTLSEALLYGCSITGMGAVTIRPLASLYLGRMMRIT